MTGLPTCHPVGGRSWAGPQGRGRDTDQGGSLRGSQPWDLTDTLKENANAKSLPGFDLWGPDGGEVCFPKRPQVRRANLTFTPGLPYSKATCPPASVS